MLPPTPAPIAVIDFRRQSMVLEWHAEGGTWTACDIPPPRVHGIALIRPSQPNICLYGLSGRLHLQLGADRFVLSENSPRIRLSRRWASFGLRRCFVVSSDTGVLFRHRYWTGQGDDFFRWLTARTADAGWCAASAARWSQGLEAAALRSS